MRVLGIDVSAQLLTLWRSWMMPLEQPFVVPALLASRLGVEDERARMQMEIADAFLIYDVGDDAIVWRDRVAARSLPPDVRRGQRARHHWPHGEPDRDLITLVRAVENGRKPSRHRELSEGLWRAAATVLPAARTLAGVFPTRSGPNCFGAVMAASGVVGADEMWMQTAQFEEWLASFALAGGADDIPGTILVWRDSTGEPSHAAVTLGGGFLLSKPSQGWMSPTLVVGVREGILSTRQPGHHLERYHLS